MKPTWRNRLLAAWWCIRGQGVLFNAEFHANNEGWVTTPDQPLLLISNCRFIGKSFVLPLDGMLSGGVQ